MKSKDIINRITDSFEGLSPKASWGETSLFYNPEKRLPNGIYFCTLKEKDGENDKASGLNWEGVFRLSFALKKTVYEELFGDRPKRPPKGGVIQSPHDFTEANTLMPHPALSQMGSAIHQWQVACYEVLRLQENGTHYSGWERQVLHLCCYGRTYG